MNAKRKLIPAVVLLLVSVLMLSTASYAWFSTNTQVTATGMQITAKTDNAYLLISSTNSDPALIQAENSGKGFTSAALTVSNEDAVVSPCSPVANTETFVYTKADSNSGTYNAATTYYTITGNVASQVVTNNEADFATYYTRGAALTQVTNKTTAGTAGNWYTANGIDGTAAGYVADIKTIKPLTLHTGYVIHKTVYLTVAVGSNNVHNLTVTPTLTQKSGGKDLSAVKILLVTDDGVCTTLTSSTSANFDIKGSNTEISPTDVRTIDIYIYYDGNDSNVYTNNRSSLAGADISLAFDVSAVAAS